MERIKTKEYIESIISAYETSQDHGILNNPNYRRVWISEFDYIALKECLKRLETAKWIPIDKRLARCSKCGIVKRTNGIDLTGTALIHRALYRFCPHCGRNMEG